MYGFIACLIAALLFAFAPLPVYYSRDFIHETLFVMATFGLILSGWRALQKKSLPSVALAGFCAALMLACKETAVIHFFAIAVAVIACWFNFGTPISRLAQPENFHILAGRKTGAPIAKIISIVAAVFYCHNNFAVHVVRSELVGIFRLAARRPKFRRPRRW